MTSSPSTSLTRAALLALACLLLLLASPTLATAASDDNAGIPPPVAAPAGPPRPAPRAALPPRKFLRPPGTAPPAAEAESRPARMDEGCAGAEDIAVYQARALVLPSGIPAYKVDVINQCLGDGCAIGGIHVRCGWFSSVLLVDPAKFRRLRHNDCLVNAGRPIRAGEVVSFYYANSFAYRLSVTLATCVDPDTLP